MESPQEYYAKKHKEYKAWAAEAYEKGDIKKGDAYNENAINYERACNQVDSALAFNRKK
jgi:hypothetical protein